MSSKLKKGVLNLHFSTS